MTDDLLRGTRILVVEDNAFLAMTTEEILRDAGAEVVGPVGTLQEAEKLAAHEKLSAAILDIRLDADEVWPVADILAERLVPFVFCSGHFDHDTLPGRWSGYPILAKPARAHRMVESLATVINDGTRTC
jgi:DNA-binding NtrC family response regulator